jgi:Xaa-Pro aminopeptidase
MQRSAAMLRAGQDVREYHLDAELLHEFRQHGSQYPAYGSIVAAGANACVLHYRADAAPIRDGELVLIDAGCELDGYASATSPAPSRPTAFHRPAAHAVRPGAGQPGRGGGGHQTRQPLHRPARGHGGGAGAGHARCGPARQEQGRQRAGRDRQPRLLSFYMHRTGHWLGMDVHDCGSYVEPAKWAR